MSKAAELVKIHNRCHGQVFVEFDLFTRLDLRKELKVQWKKFFTPRRSEWEEECLWDLSCRVGIIVPWAGSLLILGDGDGAEEAVAILTALHEPIARGALGREEPSTAPLSSLDAKWFCWPLSGCGELTERDSTGLVSTIVSKELFLDDPLLWLLLGDDTPPLLDWFVLLGERDIVGPFPLCGESGDSFLLATASRRIFVASKWSAWIAICRGERPWSFFKEGSAPYLMSSFTTWQWPYSAAAWSADSPFCNK